MSRKSSKTSHVLNLLAGPQEVDELADNEDDLEEDSDYIEIIKPKASDDPVADIIRQNLEAELTETSNTEISEPPKTEEIEERKKTSEPAKPPAEDPGYTYVNVMEHIVQEKVQEFSQPFDMCDCSRCMADITALALTNLPPKYVVKDSHSVAPLLNYYRNIYLSQITVALTKACIKVKENPKH